MCILSACPLDLGPQPVAMRLLMDVDMPCSDGVLWGGDAGLDTGKLCKAISAYAGSPASIRDEFASTICLQDPSSMGSLFKQVQECCLALCTGPVLCRGGADAGVYVVPVCMELDRIRGSLKGRDSVIIICSVLMRLHVIHARAHTSFHQTAWAHLTCHKSANAYFETQHVGLTAIFMSRHHFCTLSSSAWLVTLLGMAGAAGVDTTGGAVRRCGDAR